MNLTKQEIEQLIIALDVLVKSQKDSLAAASTLLPLREKLNKELEATDGPKP